MMLPLRIELAMTFTDRFPNVQGRARCRFGTSGTGNAVSGCNILICRPKASILRPDWAISPMNKGPEQSPWWTPERHLDRKSFLQARSAISRALRDWFEDEGFAEVETGILQNLPATRPIFMPRRPI